MTTTDNERCGDREASRLSPRAGEILLDIIRTYTRSGEPVSSRTVSKHPQHGLSAASIRNVMADLEELGYLLQPHTSAGRIPTEKGFRYYVDTTDPARLRAGTRERINSFFQSFHHELRSLLKQTSEPLTDITATRDMYWVMVRGASYDSAELLDSVRGRMGPENAEAVDWWKGNTRFGR